MDFISDFRTEKILFIGFERGISSTIFYSIHHIYEIFLPFKGSVFYDI